MKLIVKPLVIYVLIVTSYAIHAGGSATLVELLAFSQSESEYTLVVKPLRKVEIYFGECEAFVVRGSYSPPWFYIFSEFFPSRAKYNESIAFLAKRPKEFHFGWMGNGFAVMDEKEPCVVASRALELDTRDSDTFVISYFRE